MSAGHRLAIGGVHGFVTQVESDLSLIIGGNFAPDHIGRKAHDAIVNRARARPSLYVGVLADRIVGARPEAGWLSSTYVTAALELVDAPDVARPIARRLLPVFQAALKASSPSPASDPSREARIRERVADLERLAK